jgi:hypothetical protein
MPRKKGTPKTGGRQEGTPNKLTTSLKEAIQQAAETAHPEGTVGYLRQQAQTNPTAFLSLLGRTLPKELTGGGGEPLFPSRIEIVGIRANNKP